MSREALSTLKRFMQEKRLKVIQNIVQDRMIIEVYDGIPRGKAAIHAVAGHMMGEPLKQDNKVKVYYGLLREPDLQNVHMEEDEEEGGNNASQGESVSQGSTSAAQKDGAASGGTTGSQATQGSIGYDFWATHMELIDLFKSIHVRFCLQDDKSIFPGKCYRRSGKKWGRQ